MSVASSNSVPSVAAVVARRGRRSEIVATADGLPLRSGQALVELLVGLVVILVLVAGLLQVASLTNTESDVMADARAEAGELAMMDVDSSIDLVYGTDYIHDWQPGSDTTRYTPDDVWSQGNPAGFENQIVNRASPTPAGWDIIDAVPDNRFTRLRKSGDPISCFGLVKGHEKKSVEVIPAVRELLYRADTIQVESEVWMTSTKGIY